MIPIGKSASGPVTLDLSRLIVSRLLVTASSGGGKSWLLRKILEGVSATTQTLVIDTEGEFATLREKREQRPGPVAVDRGRGGLRTGWRDEGGGCVF